MPAVRSSITPAAQAAAGSAVDVQDLVNVPAGYPAQERYPGAVDSRQYGNPGIESQPKAGPVLGSQPGQPFRDRIPQQEPGGGVADLPSPGGDPQPPWDSSAGQPFAPSGALDPALHGDDSGGVRRFEHVIPAAIGKLTRHTMTGQTFNRVAPTQTEIGMTAVNGRTNLDEQQWHDPDAVERFGPFPLPYSERAIQNNVAYEAVPIDPIPTPYAPAGQLPDMSPYNSYPALAYAQPQDPAVAMAGSVPQASSPGIGGGWV